MVENYCEVRLAELSSGSGNTNRSLGEVNAKLDTLTREIGSLRQDLDLEAFRAELNRDFWVFLLFTAILSFVGAAALDGTGRCQAATTDSHRSVMATSQ